MKTFYVFDEFVDEEKFDRLLVEYNDEECENNYDDVLDEIYEDVNICGYTYQASHAFRLVDQIAYRCGLSDYKSSRLEDYQYELETNKEVNINGIEFKIFEDDEEDEETESEIE